MRNNGGTKIHETRKTKTFGLTVRILIQTIFYKIEENTKF